MRPKYGGNGQGPLETLEEPLYVSSPLGIRARIGTICRGCELEISGNSTHSGPEDHGHVRVRCHPRDGLADSLQGCIDYERRRVPPTRRTVLVWYFRGANMIFFPR